MSEILDIRACADLDMPRARAVAAQYGIDRACSPAELVADPHIDIVVNLTVPQAHAGVNQAALASGKDVYSEKPLAATRAQAQQTLDLAHRLERRIGCAPDTFLSSAQQTCRRLIDDGAIGAPLAAVAFLAGRGPEGTHPNPDFYYQEGAGPLLDMGPYYLTALINLLGPIAHVTAMARCGLSERIISSRPRQGQTISVQTDTHVAGALQFEGGAICTLVTSFEVWAHHLPRLEVYGSKGSLSAPDPNRFDGDVLLRRAGDLSWITAPPAHRQRLGRGAGVSELAYAVESGRPHRAAAELAYHVLDVMCALQESARLGAHVAVSSRCQRPAPLPLAPAVGDLTETQLFT